MVILRTSSGIPNSQRTKSPTHIGYVARRRIEHGLVTNLEWSACKLCTDDASALPADQLFELGIKSEPLTIS